VGPGFTSTQTHAAIAAMLSRSWLQKRGISLPAKLGSLQHGRALRHFHFDAIYGDPLGI